MLDIINKYRNSSKRTWLHLLIKTEMALGSRHGCQDSKDALMNIKCLKRGAFTCRRELNVRICDLCFIVGAAALCWCVMKRTKE